jgi:hypothetical protein
MNESFWQFHNRPRVLLIGNWSASRSKIEKNLVESLLKTQCEKRRAIVPCWSHHNLAVTKHFYNFNSFFFRLGWIQIIADIDPCSTVMLYRHSFYLTFIYSFWYKINVVLMQWLSPLLRFFYVILTSNYYIILTS